MKISSQRCWNGGVQNSFAPRDLRSAITAALALPITLLGGGFTSAQAQTAGGEQGRSALEEVIVTAQFSRQENLQKTPISISAITEQQLQNIGAQNITDLTRQTPNVTMTTGSANAGSGSAIIFIRGVGQGDFLSWTEPAVGIYIDDVYYGLVSGSAFSTLDLERVEVLRGPQGTLFGRNTEAGAIRLITKRPTGDGSGFLEVTGGERDHLDFKGAIDLGLIPDKLMVRISGGHSSIQGYVKRLDFGCVNPGQSGTLATNVQDPRSNCIAGHEGGGETSDLRARVRWVVSDNLDVNLTGDWSQQNMEPVPQTLLRVINTNAVGLGVPGFVPPGLPPTFGWNNWPCNAPPYPPGYGANCTGVRFDGRFIPRDPYTTYESFTDPAFYDKTAPAGSQGPKTWAPTPVNKNATWGTSASIDWRFNEGLSLKSVTAYREVNGAFVTDGDVSPVGGSTLYQGKTNHQFQQELRLTSDFWNQRINLTVGAFYFEERSVDSGMIDLQWWTGFPVLGYPLTFRVNDPSHVKDKAGFADATFHLTDAFTVMAGIRYSNEEKSYQFFRQYLTPCQLGSTDPACAGNLAGPVVFADPADFVQPGVTPTEKRWDPRLVLQYQLTPDLMTYASYATGFKAGGFNGRPSTPEEVFAFLPEEVQAYELGVKSSFFGNRLRFNADVFYSHYKDIQTGLGNAQITGIPRLVTLALVNAIPGAIIRGFEAEVSAVPVDRLQVDATVGYTSFSYQAGLSSQFGQAFPPTNTPGAPVEPPLNTPEWKASLGAQYEIPFDKLGSLTPRVDVSYTSEQDYGSSFRSLYSTDLRNSLIQGAVTLVNARLTWRSEDSKWTTALAVDNVTDKLWYTNRADQTLLFAYTAGTPAPPRTWSVRIRRDF